MIGPNSRYLGVKVLEWTTRSGAKVQYLARREIPASSGTPLGIYTTRAGERFGNIAARTLGNPTLFWEIADANAVVDPLAIPTSPGLKLSIPLPTAKGS